MIFLVNGGLLLFGGLVFVLFVSGDVQDWDGTGASSYAELDEDDSDNQAMSVHGSNSSPVYSNLESSGSLLKSKHPGYEACL